MRIKLTRNDAEEVLHKLAILAYEPDLQEGYGLNQVQATALRDSVPRNGGEWLVATEFVESVKGEMQDHAAVLRDMARDAANELAIGDSLVMHKQAKKFEEAFK